VNGKNTFLSLIECSYGIYHQGLIVSMLISKSLISDPPQYFFFLYGLHVVSYNTSLFFIKSLASQICTVDLSCLFFYSFIKANPHSRRAAVL